MAVKLYHLLDVATTIVLKTVLNKDLFSYVYR